MLNSILMYLAPFVVTLAIAGALRVFGGAKYGAPLAGFAAVLVFIAAWLYFLHPGLLAQGNFARIGHIAFGGAVIGLLLDLLTQRRPWFFAGAGVFVLVSAWASLNGSLLTPAPHDLMFFAALIALAAVGGVILVRLGAGREKGATSVILLMVAALGLVAMAAVVHDRPLGATGLMLTAALLAYMVSRAGAPLPVEAGVVLGGGGAVLAIAWALAQGHPAIRLGLLLVPLIFFAEGTAQRVPLPKARISAVLYPLILAAVAALPLLLAVVVVYITARA